MSTDLMLRLEDRMYDDCRTFMTNEISMLERIQDLDPANTILNSLITLDLTASGTEAELLEHITKKIERQSEQHTLQRLVTLYVGISSIYGSILYNYEQNLIEVQSKCYPTLSKKLQNKVYSRWPYLTLLPTLQRVYLEMVSDQPSKVLT